MAKDKAAPKAKPKKILVGINPQARIDRISVNTECGPLVFTAGRPILVDEKSANDILTREFDGKKLFVEMKER